MPLENEVELVHLTQTRDPDEIVPNALLNPPVLLTVEYSPPTILMPVVPLRPVRRIGPVAIDIARSTDDADPKANGEINHVSIDHVVVPVVLDPLFAILFGTTNPLTTNKTVHERVVCTHHKRQVNKALLSAVGIVQSDHHIVSVIVSH